jgi:hypothetical protein
MQIKGSQPGSSEIAVVVNSCGGTNAIFLNPLKVGDATDVVYWKEVEPCEGRAASEPDPSIVKWVEMIWKNYDVDGNDILDMAEAWRFIKENMGGQTTRDNFNI